MATLHENIMALCDAKGIKGGRMCAETGISKSLLTDLKMGRRTGVSAVTAQKIASYFGVSVGYLLGNEADPSYTSKSSQHNKPATADSCAPNGAIKHILTDEEQDLLDKYRCLDDRGRASVRNVLEYETRSKNALQQTQGN